MKTKAKLSILSELLSFPTVRGKDWDSSNKKPEIGDLVSLSSAPDSKWYVSWVREYDPNNGWPKYLLESIEDGELCWWQNVGINIYSRDRVRENPQWKWDDQQLALASRWYKVCRRNEVHPVRPCQPIFYDDGSVELDVRIHIFHQSDFHNPKVFQSYKKVTVKEMEEHYLTSASKYKKEADHDAP